MTLDVSINIGRRATTAMNNLQGCNITEQMATAITIDLGQVRGVKWLVRYTAGTVYAIPALDLATFGHLGTTPAGSFMLPKYAQRTQYAAKRQSICSAIQTRVGMVAVPLYLPLDHPPAIQLEFAGPRSKIWLWLHHHD